MNIPYYFDALGTLLKIIIMQNTNHPLWLKPTLPKVTVGRVKLLLFRRNSFTLLCDLQCLTDTVFELVIRVSLLWNIVMTQQLIKLISPKDSEFYII